MFSPFKKIEKMSVPELELRETFELVDQQEVRLKKLDSLADSLLSKAMLAHSLIVVRKVSEDKESELNQVLDP